MPPIQFETRDRVKSIRNKKRGTLAKWFLVVATLSILAVIASLASYRPKPVAPVEPPSSVGSTLPTSPPAPAALVASGAPTQGVFTLAAVTSVGNHGFTTPPSIADPNGASIGLNTTEGGTGLWFKVEGGVGFRTITVPLDGRQHVTQTTDGAVVVQGTQTNYSIRWQNKGVVQTMNDMRQSYALGPSSVVGGNVSIFLIPTKIYRKYHISVQPLSGNALPTSRPVDLVCSAVSPNALFAQVPTGYNSQTQEMLVKASVVGSRVGAVWRLTNLPPSVTDSVTSARSRPSYVHGPISLAAVAAESQDFSGIAINNMDQQTDRPAGNGFYYSAPTNIDDHAWTGVPTVNLLLRSTIAGANGANQDWIIRFAHVTPELQCIAQSIMPPMVMPLSSANLLHWQAGVAYPGQQRWVKVDGDLLRFVHRTEQVTFHNAQIVQDPKTGEYRLFWSAAETETTPSGIAVTVLNERPGATDYSNDNYFGGGSFGGMGGGPPGMGGPPPGMARFSGAPVGFSRRPALSQGTTLLAAWKLPPDFLTDTAPIDSPIEVSLPRVDGKHLTSLENRVPDWDCVRLPDMSDFRPMKRMGFAPILVPVNAPGNASQSPTYAGTNHATTSPSAPRFMKTITLDLDIRELKQTQHFALVVPVKTSFPPGWNQNDFDGHYPIPKNTFSGEALSVNSGPPVVPKSAL